MKTAAIIFAICSMFLGACGSASVVRQDTLGGRIELSGGYMKAMSDARLLAAEACGGRIELVEYDGGIEYACSNPTRTTVLVSNELQGAIAAQ